MGEVIPIRESFDSPGGLLQLMAAYAPTFLEYRTRAERSTVESRYGRRVFDRDLRETWEGIEGRMNDLLEQYHAHLIGKAALEGVPHDQIVSEHAAAVQEQGKGQE